MPIESLLFGTGSLAGRNTLLNMQKRSESLARLFWLIECLELSRKVQSENSPNIFGDKIMHFQTEGAERPKDLAEERT